MQGKLVCCILVIYLLGCTETEYPHKFPLVVTDEVTNISSSGVTFSGRIANSSSQKIISYGFIWEQDIDPTINSSKVVIGSNATDGSFSEVVTNDLEENRIYFVKAFIQTETLLIYGESKKFTSEGSLTPSIVSFSPDKGVDGSQISISGDNFSEKEGGNRVTIGGVVCDIVSFGKKELVVNLPLCGLVGPFPINVEVANQTGTSSTPFVIIGPIIKSISSLSGRVGDELTISGEYFNLADYMEVTVGDPEYGPNAYNNISQLTSISDVTGKWYVPNFAGNTSNLILHSNLPGNYKIQESSIQFTVLDSWQQRSSATPIQDYPGYTSAQLNNTVFVLGGRSVYAYDLTTRTWSQKADFPGAYRFDGTAFTYNGKLYYGFGAGHHEPYNGSNWQYFNDLWSFDPLTNSWTSLGLSPMEERANATALTINSKVYIGFGSKPNPSLIKYGDLWEYNVNTNSWTQLNTSAIQGDFTFEPSAFTVGGKGYFVDLHNATAPYTTELWEFDPAQANWTRKADLPDWETRGPATTIAGHGLVICDVNSVPRVYEYDPANNIWIRRQTLQAAIAPLKFIGVSDSKVHLGGKEVWELSFD